MLFPSTNLSSQVSGPTTAPIMDYRISPSALEPDLMTFPTALLVAAVNKGARETIANNIIIPVDIVKSTERFPPPHPPSHLHCHLTNNVAELL